ncbi:hypothetical protein LRB67_05230 [Borreliella bissettiae]|uniref:hypothetical protein n=1 Tax=Borrelia bissettiae TaxID=64897 RepID=UPI001E5069D0|nr:hypothetical protein [Borreliella bissettiae]MCD2401656.1 hypothetical protein [Borreliella bissettiae]
MFNINIKKYYNSNKEIDIFLLEKNLNNLENKIQIITNKYAVGKIYLKLKENPGDIFKY